VDIRWYPMMNLRICDLDSHHVESAHQEAQMEQARNLSLFHGLDNSLQVQASGPPAGLDHFGVLKNVWKCEGFRVLYDVFA